MVQKKSKAGSLHQQNRRPSGLLGKHFHLQCLSDPSNKIVIKGKWKFMLLYLPYLHARLFYQEVYVDREGVSGSQLFSCCFFCLFVCLFWNYYGKYARSYHPTESDLRKDFACITQCCQLSTQATLGWGGVAISWEAHLPPSPRRSDITRDDGYAMTGEADA